MFDFCTNPDTLNTLHWFACYLTNGAHRLFYVSFLTVFALLALAAPLAVALGFGAAAAARGPIRLGRWVAKTYIAMVRGVPDIVFFLFFVLVLDQGIEYLRHVIVCPDWPDAVRQGANFIVCDAARTPHSSAPQWVHEGYNFGLAVFTYALVFGAFCGNVLFGAMQAIPMAQIETAEAYGMTRAQVFWRVIVPQMWIYALPGLSNIWMILIKTTPLLFLLGIEDIVYWARELGGSRTSAFQYPHPDWRFWYFMALLVFYLGLTRVSEIVRALLTRRLRRGQPTVGGEELQTVGA